MKDPASQPVSARTNGPAAGGNATGRGRLTRQQKAAVIIGVLGAEAAGPVLAQFDEASLRRFTAAMSGLERVEAIDVRAAIAEFLSELHQDGQVVRGGLSHARGLLENHVAEGVLARILDDAAPASPQAVWKSLAKVGDDTLAAYLAQEHPQIASVILSRFSADHSARIINRMPPELAHDVILGLARTATLDPQVIDAIGETIGRNFLAAQAEGREKRSPAERAGAIMNFTAPALRDRILELIERDQPDFAGEIRRKMFTVADIPARLPGRAVAAVVRSLDQDTLLKALHSTQSDAPEIGDFILSNISTRMAAQIREELAQVTAVRARDAERAQAELIRVIRDLTARGEIELTEDDDEES